MLKTILEFRRGVLFVRLDGILDKETVLHLNQNVTNRIIEGGIRNVVFNLKKLKSIDFKGMNALLYIYELCNKKHGKLLICGLEDETIYNKLLHNHLFKYFIPINNEINAFELVGI